MSDWIGLVFLLLLIAGAWFGLRALAKPRPRTSEEFERNAAEGTTALGASMNALQELMNPDTDERRSVSEKKNEREKRAARQKIQN
jgi:hypothetical protein